MRWSRSTHTVPLLSSPQDAYSAQGGPRYSKLVELVALDYNHGDYYDYDYDYDYDYAPGDRQSTSLLF
jgi:hypothetical protein